MDNPFDQKKFQELVLYQAIMHRSNPSAPAVVSRQMPNYPAGTSLSSLELNPGIKRIFEKLQRQIFYHSDWWSAIHSDKGLIIDLRV